MKCAVCDRRADFLFAEKVLYKYEVRYYKCTDCGSIQTEKPYWLAEAYGKAISALDIGLLSRNFNLSNQVFDILASNFDIRAKFLDYGGGYGVLVRLLRDKGLNFFRQDIYCENIFAVNHDIADLDSNDRQFELVTCFEVFEHTDQPGELLEDLVTYTSNILISTLLVPGHPIRSVADWWYFVPETGQHITFYTKEALLVLAEKFKMNLYSNGESLHLLTVKKFDKNPLEIENGFKDKLMHKIITYLTPPRKTGNNLVENDLNIARKKVLNKLS